MGKSRGWTCRKCRAFNVSKRTLNCASCGTRRKVRRSKHAQLLDAARPQYETMLAAQGGRCAICLRSPSEDRKFDIDHDHVTLRVRGLLDHRCNRSLHSWMTPEWLRAAADYLEHPPAYFDVRERSGQSPHASSVLPSSEDQTPETERAA